MTGAVLERPGSLFGAAPEPACRERAMAGGRATLEERLNSVLQAARANRSTECPVCHERMTSTRAGACVEAVCSGCGSQLT